MLYSRLLPYGIFAIVASAKSSSSSSSDVMILSGTSEVTPTGSYVSYSSTRTLTTSSVITTSALLSTVTSGSSRRTTTLGSTTIFASASMAGNSSSTSTSKSSQILLQGSGKSSTSLNGTASATNNSSTSAAPQPTNTTPCNNYPEFCARKYGNITEVAAHNSPFVKADNAASNQALDVTTQLNDGIRLLQGQMHFVNNTPHFCHTSCDVLDAGPITDYLGQVQAWISSHPYDVITILLGNGNYSTVESYVPFIEQTGLVQYAYLPPKIPMALHDWPTLGSMILTGKRVVFFMDYNANQTSTPWILDEFSQMWETPFDPTDRTFPCTVSRPPNQPDADTKNKLYLTNHNLNYDLNILGNSILVPSLPLLNVTNNVTGTGSLGVNAQNCVGMWGFPPKFLNVDYYNVGNGSVFEVAATWNNVTYNRPCCGIPLKNGAAPEVVGRGTMVAAFAVVAASWALL